MKRNKECFIQKKNLIFVYILISQFIDAQAEHTEFH